MRSIGRLASHYLCTEARHWHHYASLMQPLTGCLDGGTVLVVTRLSTHRGPLGRFSPITETDIYGEAGIAFVQDTCYKHVSTMST